jgi:hypothetical protein
MVTPPVALLSSEPSRVIKKISRSLNIKTYTSATHSSCPEKQAPKPDLYPLVSFNYLSGVKPGARKRKEEK